MLVKLDDEVIFEIDETMLNLISDYVVDPIPDIKRRLEWVITHLCEQCFSRVEKEWTEKFRNDPEITSIPSKKTHFADFVFSHPEYKNRAQREQEGL